MSGEYTDEEIKERLGEVLDQTISIDRRAFFSADFIIDSLKALVGKALNSESDAFYYLVKLFTIGQSIKCQKILTYLDDIERFAFIGNREIPLSDPTKLEDILDAFEDMAEANSLSEVSNHNTRLSNHVKSLLRDSKRADGSLYTGYDPSKAKQKAVTALENLKVAVADVTVAAHRYLGAHDNYKLAELSKFPLVRLAQESKKLFSRYVEETAQSEIITRVSGRLRLNILDAIRDIVLVSSVIDRRRTKVDLNASKYDSTVTTVGRTPAVLSGDTVPFTYPIFQGAATIGAGGSIHIKVDGVHSDNITSDYAPSPVMKLSTTQSKIYGTEQGRFAIGDGNPATAVSSGVAGTPFLKTYTPKEGLVISYRDTIGQPHTIEWDGNLAAFADEGDPLNSIAVTLVEDVGALFLDFSVPGAKTPGNFEPIDVAYTYYIIGDYTVRDSLGAIVLNTQLYNKFSVFFQNTLVTYTPSNAQVVSTDKVFWGQLGGEINSNLGAGGLTLSVAVAAPGAPGGGPKISSSEEGGSGTRIAFPNYTTDLPQLNTELFAPTWLTGGSHIPPLDLNRVLSAVHSTYAPVRGKDIKLGDLTVGPVISDKLVLRTLSASIGVSADGVATLASDGELVTTADTSAYSIGDTIEVTSPYTGITKITSVSSPTSIKVYPHIALDFDPAPGAGGLGEVLADTPIVFNVSRNIAQIQSVSSDVSSSIQASAPEKGGFGFSDISLGSSNQVTLESVEIGKPIRSGDWVFQGALKIGTVSSRLGTTLRINLDPSVTPAYPYTSLRIESLGKMSYYTQKTPVQDAFLALGRLAKDGRYNKNIAPFINSGTGVDLFLGAISSLRATVTSLKSAYDEYEANSVSEVDALVRTLNEEKLTLVLFYLRNLDFSSVSDLTAEEVSTQSSMENLLEEVSVALGGNISYVELIEGDSRLDDYFTRGDGTSIDEQ